MRVWVSLSIMLLACGEDPAPAPEPAPGETEAVEAEPQPEPELDEAPDPDAVPIAGPVVLGEPAEVTVPAVVGPSSQRDLMLSIASAERIRCDAHAEHDGEERDAQMALVRDDEVLMQNSDAGEGFDARLELDATEGTYHVRVWEWLYREATLTVRCARVAD